MRRIPVEHHLVVLVDGLFRRLANGNIFCGDFLQPWQSLIYFACHLRPLANSLLGGYCKFCRHFQWPFDCAAQSFGPGWFLRSLRLLARVTWQRELCLLAQKANFPPEFVNQLERLVDIRLSRQIVHSGERFDHAPLIQTVGHGGA